MYEARERKTCPFVEAWVQEEGAAQVEESILGRDLVGRATLVQ